MEVSIESLKKLQEYLTESSNNLESLKVNGQANVYHVYRLFLFTNEAKGIIDDLLKEDGDKKEG